MQPVGRLGMLIVAILAQAPLKNVRS